jgi:chemosensory pili system protein ChpA (sensor histidine kinase/response regulator)
MTVGLDYSALNWVKAELDETLKQARVAMEAFVENKEDEAQLQFCVAHLHQVYGTLQMVELYGAALVAEEMEQVARALLEKKIPHKEDTFEVLMRAMLQLPDYLERLQGGQKDVPVALLPLLNDLRASRGGKLLSESALFSPNLASAPSALLQTGPYGVELPDIAKQQRHPYQLSLLGWFRGQDEDKHLAMLGKILHSLRELASKEQVAQMFWAGEGLIDALLNKTIEASVSVKLLLGQVDRKIKAIIDGGEDAAVMLGADDLVKNLLYYIARSTSDSGLAYDLKHAFNLEHALPSDDDINQARGSLTGMNVDVINTVHAALLDDLGKIKDALDIYMRSEQRDMQNLQSLPTDMKKVADTLAMLGMGVQRNQIIEQSQALSDMLESEAGVNDDSLMDIAGSILVVEAVLQDSNPAVAGMAKSTVIQGTGMVPESEFRGILSAVVREAKVDMSRVKDAIVEFVSAPWEFKMLEEVPRLNQSIRGSLIMLSLDRVAEMLSLCNEYVQHELLEKEHIPEQDTLNALADAISSIEYYLEAVDEGRKDTDAILDVIARSIDKLGYGASGGEAAEVATDETILDFEQAAEPEMVSAEEPETVPASELEQTAQAEPEQATEPEAGEQSIEELLGELTPPGAEAAPIEEITFDETVEEIEAAAEPAPEPEPVQAAAPPPQPVAMEDIDDDIVEIFLEEVEEELVNIRDHLPKWQTNPADKDALTTVRRSFHTLKGSGRMVGANELGEFAWSFENMLNRVLDGTISHSLEMFEVLNDGVAAIPEMVQHFKTGQTPALDVQSLVDKANAFAGRSDAPRLNIGSEPVPAVESISEPGVDTEAAAADAGHAAEPDMESLSQEWAEVSLDADEIAEIQAQTEQAEETPEADVLDIDWGEPVQMGEEQQAEPAAEQVESAAEEEVTGIDPVLLEIFTKESSGYIHTIRDYVDNARTVEDPLVTDELLRAMHTLHGSAHMAGITDIAHVSDMLEKYIKLLMHNELPVPSDALDLMLESINDIDAYIPLINSEGELAKKDEYLARIGMLHGRAEQAIEKAGTEAEPLSPVEEQVTGLSARSEAESWDEELLDIFLEEGEEILDSSEVTLQNWVNDQGNNDLVQQLQRELHTLKGGARMANVGAIGDLSHALESMIIAVVDGRVKVSRYLFDLMQHSHDSLTHMLQQVKNNENISHADDLIEKINKLVELKGEIEESVEAEETAAEVAGAAEQEAEEAVAEEVAEQAPAEEAVAAEESAVEEAEQPVEESAEVVPFSAAEAETRPVEPEALAVDRRKAPRIQHEQIRVRADLLDNLVNYAGEVSIYRSRVEQQVGVYKFNLTELEQTIQRLREQLRQFEIETEAQIVYRYEREQEEMGHKDEEFDPLEMDRFSTMQQLSRSLLESVGDLSSIQGLLESNTRETETLLLQQSRVTSDLQEGLMRTRMVPLSTQLPRLRRIVRQTSSELGKQVDFNVVGEEGELDRTMLERMMPPLEHMLRNAIDHGIEMPSQRKQSGKNEQGSINLTLSREGSEIVMVLSDDGSGINLEAIRKKAMERGLIKQDSDITDKEVLQFILESGFSTAQKVTQISGRGVGMDVVNSEIKQLGGTLSIDSDPGQGTRFIVRLPLTLSVNKALLVNVGDDKFAIPLSSVEAVVRASDTELREFHTNPNATYEYAGYNYRFMHLGTLLGLSTPQLPQPGRKIPVLLVRAGDHRVALQIDGLMGSREIVVKPVGPQISNVRGISGATILGDGSVALILEVSSVVLMDVAQHGVVEEETKAEKGVITVMVVDDSITVRRVTSRLLERNGMQVITAKDGVDAVAVLQEHIPDIFLLDIEMPRMDGYELATHIRNNEKTRELPIIMITSRTGDKHRKRAEDIGVNQYLGKPYQESELLDNIYQLLGKEQV